MMTTAVRKSFRENIWVTTSRISAYDNLLMKVYATEGKPPVS
jgi:hypothetical protein